MNEKKQKFVVYSVPCERAFEIDKQHAEDFKNQCNTAEEKNFVKSLAEEFKKNNLVEEEPSVLAVPCDRAFIVAPEKAKEFNEIKPNPELLKKIEDASKKLNIRVELDEGPILKRALTPSKK